MCCRSLLFTGYRTQLVPTSFTAHSMSMLVTIPHWLSWNATNTSSVYHHVRYRHSCSILAIAFKLLLFFTFPSHWVDALWTPQRFILAKRKKVFYSGVLLSQRKPTLGRSSVSTCDDIPVMSDAANGTERWTVTRLTKREREWEWELIERQLESQNDGGEVKRESDCKKVSSHLH